MCIYIRGSCIKMHTLLNNVAISIFEVWPGLSLCQAFSMFYGGDNIIMASAIIVIGLGSYYYQ